jgi:hypothetical protein
VEKLCTIRGIPGGGGTSLPDPYNEKREKIPFEE